MRPLRKANRLIHSNSPYLLQHAFNPVNWNEWDEAALGRARQEDKPILVSIGYSACHWCHVMERESFENEEIAKIMNEFFICIKVDREERPDIDHIYMDAVQAMQQAGGWPLNVFLTSDQKPFYGGTYFRPSQWAHLLRQIQQAYQQKRSQVEISAKELVNHLQITDLKRFAREPGLEKFTLESLDHQFDALASRFDNTRGGIEKAPKFVMPTIWQFLLRYYALTGNQSALDMVNLTLTKIRQGGLYDQIGGGFSRYSVDPEWFAPHFEKMIYDNAQLISLYSEAFSITRDPLFRKIIEDTNGWLEREMMDSSGGFYSALDADSEQVEGKFYTWTIEELKEILGEDAAETAAYYHITPQGNWEHGRSILKTNESVSIPEYLERNRKLMLEYRNKRIRPSLDDKMISGWNALLIKGFIDAYKSLGDQHYLQLALKNAAFIETSLMVEGKLYRSYKQKRSGTEGFLEDYAFLLQAFTGLYEVTFEETWLKKSSKLLQYILDFFYDEKEGYFLFSSKESPPLVANKKEIFDNVIPSSNSVMARNLLHLGTILNRRDWKDIAINMTSRLSELIEGEPGYMSHWSIVYAEITHGLSEVVIMGQDCKSLRKSLHGHFLPFIVSLGAEGNSELELLKDRGSFDQSFVFVCRDNTCQLPVTTVNEALHQLKD